MKHLEAFILLYENVFIYLKINIIHCFNRYSFFSTATNYNNDKLEGLTKVYSQSGQLRKEINCKNDKQEGIEKVYYKSGQLQVEINYKNDKMVSEKFYDESGKLIN